MFTKINKKIIIIFLIVLALVLVTGFVLCKYVLGKKYLNSSNGAVIQQQQASPAPQDNSPFKINAPKTELQTPTQPKGSLMICTVRCGDGICQRAGEVCPQNDNLNYACAETHANCPQDCK